MEIGEQDLAFAQHRPFDGLRFLDLDYHVAFSEYFGSGGCDGRSGIDIFCVFGANAESCTGFDQHIMAVGCQFPD